FAVVTHVATIAATLLGAGIMALPQPRVGLAAFAVVDLLLAYACFRVLGRGGVAAADVAPTVEGPVGAGRRSGWPGGRPAAGLLPAVALVAAIVFVVEVGRNVVRPFFTAYVEGAGAAPLLAAGLFLLPSVAALAVLPAAEAARRGLGRALLPVAFAVAALGLLAQAVSADPAVVAIGRLIFGAGLGFGQIALDLRIFAATGVRGPAFAAVETVSTIAMLASPLLATAAVAVALPGPLLVGAAVFAVLAVLVALGHRRPVPVPKPVAVKENRVLEPVH
ncbi:MAG TPA: hypothetical protein VFO77_14870, partial [Actinoplanes sp.]|nr:hypothetical protein [Actinoplanes sp.]